MGVEAGFDGTWLPRVEARPSASLPDNADVVGVSGRVVIEPFRVCALAS